MNAQEFLKWYNENDGEPENDDIKVVFEGNWEQDYKYQHCEIVYSYQPESAQIRYFSVCLTRSGSPFTDWEYNDPECYEVVPVEVTKTIYKVKE